MALVQTIVSGGQTGVDRAALDFAIERGVPHRGWRPRGRKAQDGAIDARYKLKETSTASYLQRTEWNVRDSDGPVVFSIAPTLTGGSAHNHGKPVLHLARDGGPGSPELARRRFIEANGIKAINVPGSKVSREPGVYGFVMEVMTKAVRR